jgi:AcrR family transcriptional regulator
MAVVRDVSSEPAAAGPPGPHRLRADAERNRAALLGGARAVFAELGLEAPLETIAHRAGVGIATLYRHFPTREQLVAAALLDQVADYLCAAEQALASDDPWSGFVGFVERICAMQADDRGLGDLLSMALPADQEIEELRARANAMVIALVERAKSAGQLRADFAGEDLLLLLIANAAIVHVTARDAPDAWRRLMALQLDAFRARGNAARLPEAPSTQAMARAMLRLARSRGCAGPAAEDGESEHGAARGSPAGGAQAQRTGSAGVVAVEGAQGELGE